MKRTAILEGVAQAFVSVQRSVEQSLTESIIDKMIAESTLSKIIGDSPGGQNLVRWLHNHDKLSNTAEYDESPVKGQRIQWQMFKNSPDHFLIVSGSNGVVGIKPSKEHIDRGYEVKGDKYNPSKDNSLPYQVVAFRKDQRVDNLLIPDPEDPRRKKVLNPDAAPTIITARGGVPGTADPRGEHNIFDQMKEAIGTLQAVYIASRRSQGIPKKDVKGFVKGYTSSEVPPKAISGGSGDAEGAIERGKLAQRRPASVPHNAQHELRKIFSKLAPVFAKIGSQAITIASQRGEDPAKIQQIQQSIKTGGADVILRALKNVSGFEQDSPEFADWLNSLNSGPVTGYADVINAIRRELA